MDGILVGQVEKNRGEIMTKRQISLKERADLYNAAFPKYSQQAWMQASDRWLWGVWMMGNNYKGSGYHGSFPPGFLKRTMSMFPDAKDILHLFSGSLTDEVDGDRLDMNADTGPDICGDAHELSNLVKKEYDLIIADPPYSEEDANKYGTPMVNRNAVVKECIKVLKPGGYLVWLDMVYPMYSSKELQLVGTIGIIRSTNHRVRGVFIYQKLP